MANKRTQQDPGRSTPLILEHVENRLPVPDISASNEQENKYVIPLDGKWFPAASPAYIGKNFRTMTNFRYVDGRPEGILGMTAITGTPVSGTNFLPRSAFHFKKDQPSESHLLLQSYGTSGSTFSVYESTYTVPFTGSTAGLFASAIWAGTSNGTVGAQFSYAPDDQMVYSDSINNCIWGGKETRVGAFIHYSTCGITGMGGTIGTFSFDYTERMNNSKTDSGNIITLTNGTDGKTRIKVGSTRKLQGVKFYVQTPNTSAGTCLAYYWNGTADAAIEVDDSSLVGGVRLGQTGEVRFASTVNEAKLKYVNDRLLYFYDFVFTGIVNTTQLYYCTVDAPFQPIYDIWDGSFSNVAAYFRYTTAYYDETVNVENDDYDGSDGNTYSDLSGMSAYTGTSNWLEIGFTNKQKGVLIGVPSLYPNTSQGTANVQRWDGGSYIAQSYIDDDTKAGGVPLAQDGVVLWNINGTDGLVRKSVQGSLPLYFYKVGWNNNMGGSPRIYYIAGIPDTSKISGYSFSLHAGDRLMLGCDNYGKKNSLIISAKYQPEVFNGTDSYELEIGDGSALTCGASIFAQYGSNIFNMALMFKDSQTWMLKWEETLDEIVWDRYPIAPTIGCPAPQTLKVASVSFDKTISQTKLIAIWRGHNGIYVSDGHAPLNVSSDIDTIFHQSSALHVNVDMLKYETSFIDYQKMEYHWQWASGSNTTLNKEYVLDMVRWQWFEVDRTTGKYLQCGADMADTQGNRYAYGFDNSGNMYRLENGTTMAGVAIPHTLEFGEQLPISNDVMAKVTIERMNLISVAKNTDSVVVVTHTIDGSTSGSSSTMSDADASHVYANVMKDVYSSPGIFHSFKLQKSTSSETKGFEPLYFSVYYSKVRDHLR